VNIIDLGLGQAIIKHVAFYHGANESAKLRILVRTANSLFLLIGTIGLVIFVGIALYGKDIMPNTFSAYSQYSPLFFLTGAIFFIDSIFRGYNAIINGLQRYDLMAKIGMLIFTSTSIGTLLIVLYGGKLYPIFILQLVMTCISGISIFIAVRKTEPDTTSYALAWNIKEIKRSYSFALASSINGIAGLAILYLDKLIMPFYVGPSNLTYYSMPGGIASRIPGFSGSITTMLFPMASNLSAADKKAHLEILYVRSVRLITIASAAITISCISFSHQVLEYWLNADFADKATGVLVILALTNFVLSLTNLASNFLLGIGKLRLLTITSFVTSALNVALLLLLLPTYGILGAAWAYLLSLVPFIYLFYHVEKKYLSLTARKAYYARHLIGTIIVSIIVYGLDHFFIAPYMNNLLSVLIAAGISGVIYIILYRLFGFFDSEDWNDLEYFGKMVFSRYSSVIKKLKFVSDINMIIERIQRKILKIIISLSKDPRPGSYPFISGDTFRKLADKIYDETSRCRPEDIRENDVIFIKGDFIDEFFGKIHPYIIHRYKIITHNSDREIGAYEAAYIDDKIIRWFAQNNTFAHQKITPIPIGMENKRYFMSGWVLQKMASKFRAKDIEKKNRILFGFSVETNHNKRVVALESLRKCAMADELKTRPSLGKYFEILNQYKFVACPEGNGPDTHRVWEAMLLGTIPVALSNPIVEHFKTLGLPILIIDNWQNLMNMSEKDLESDYKEIMSRCGPTKDNLLAVHYWQGVIRAPEDKRDEAVVAIIIGREYEKTYEQFFKKSQERLCFGIRRPFIIVRNIIKKADKHPSWQKLVIFETPILSNINRVMLLDADIYIKDVSLNPMDLVPENNWGLALNNAFNLPTLAKTDLTLYQNCPEANRPSFVLNCGFFIVNKQIHKRIMKYVFNNYEEQVCLEQGPTSYHLITESPGTILPFKFDNIVGSYMEKFGYSMTSVMNMYKESNFLHFAGHANRKILRVYLVFEKYPFVYRMVSWPPLLVAFDHMSQAVKELKKIT